MSATKRHKPEQRRLTQEAIRESRESKKIQELSEEIAELLAEESQSCGRSLSIGFLRDPGEAATTTHRRFSSRIDRVSELVAKIADILGRQARLTFTHICAPPRPVPPQRPQPLETCDQNWRVDDALPDYVMTGDFGRFDPGMAGIEPSILGRIWRAQEITARLAAAGQLGDLPPLNRYLVRPAWSVSRYISEMYSEPECEAEGVAHLMVQHHPHCPVTSSGHGCHCVFLVIIAIGEREWSVGEDGTLTVLPEMQIRFGSVRRYRPALSDFGRGLPEFSDVVRRRGAIYWDRHGVAFIPDYYRIAFAGDVAFEIDPNPLPAADDDE